MTYTAMNYCDAAIIARRLRAIYARDGWKVTIIRPLFAGDHYTITVG